MLLLHCRRSMPRTVTIGVFEARCLAAADSNGLSDPYCIVKIGETELGRTRIKEKTLDPVWNEQFTIDMAAFIDSVEDSGSIALPVYHEHFVVELWDWDRFSNHDNLGYVRVPLSSATVLRDPKSSQLSHEFQSYWYTVVGKNAHTKRQQLSRLLPPDDPRYTHLYSSCNMCFIHSVLGPCAGETVLEKHDGVSMSSSQEGDDLFGDEGFRTIRGTLILTDLRFIFISIMSTPTGDGREAGDHSSIVASDRVALERTDSALLAQGLEDYLPASTALKTVLHAHARTWQIPVGAIANTSYRSADDKGHECFLYVVGKDGKRGAFCVARRVLGTRHEAHRLAPKAWIKRVREEILWLQREDKFSVRFSAYWNAELAALKTRRAGSNRFNFAGEYNRLGLPDARWRITSENLSYGLCATYPSLLCVPASVEDERLHLAAAARSRNRVPCLVWLHPTTKTPLCRSSQPKGGVGGQVPIDHQYLMHIHSACPSQKQLRIIDARPRINAEANKIKGKGFENVHMFAGKASINFMDIANIHAMRESLTLLTDACHDGGSDFYTRVSNSQWLQHVSAVLRGAWAVAASLLQSYPVLVHCSDGWDRTSQLSSLAQLMLDPYYRTIAGFQALVEKEWCSFGHMFKHRLSTHPRENCPVFLQFLDCVWQLQRQFPADFEFSAKYLVFLAEAAYSQCFNTFLDDCERDRFMRADGTGVWPYLEYLANIGPASAGLVNPFYVPERGNTGCSVSACPRSVRPIKPCSDLRALGIWTDMYMPRTASLTGTPFQASLEDRTQYMLWSYARYSTEVMSSIGELQGFSRMKMQSMHVSGTYTFEAACGVAAPLYPVRAMPYRYEATWFPPDSATWHLHVHSNPVTRRCKPRSEVEAARAIQIWYRALVRSRSFPARARSSARLLAFNGLKRDAHMERMSELVSTIPVTALVREIIDGAVDVALEREYSRQHQSGSVSSSNGKPRSSSVSLGLLEGRSASNAKSFFHKKSGAGYIRAMWPKS